MTFWDFFILLLIYVPLVLIWAFSLADVFRRDDIGGGAKALWFAGIILVPFFGTLVYLIVRPAGATAAERQVIDDASRRFVQRYSEGDSEAEQLRILAELHEAGRLDAEEFAQAKRRVLDGDPERQLRVGNAARPSEVPLP